MFKKPRWDECYDQLINRSLKSSIQENWEKEKFNRCLLFEICFIHFRIWESLSCVPWFLWTVYPLVFHLKRQVFPGNQGTHDKLNQIRFFKQILYYFWSYLNALLWWENGFNNLLPVLKMKIYSFFKPLSKGVKIPPPPHHPFWNFHCPHPFTLDQV